MPARIMIRYGEIALKGKNRRFFENALLQNLKRAVKGLPVIINRTQGRFIASAPEDLQATALDHLSKVFGVVSLSLVTPATLDMEAIKTAAVALATQIAGGLNTFKVITRRPNKNFPLSSPEISRDVGAYLLEQNPGLKVDLHKPAFTIFIEIGAQEAFLYHKNVNGPGGLPVGVSGQALLLLSGGIDSPVAGWMAMKRGLSIGALHFHSYPFTSIRSQEKAIDLCRTINRFGGPMPLHMISLASIQKAIRTNCPEELGIILLRRMMIRLSDKLCRRSGIKALVTGESLGQVASQTLESMEVISAVTRMLILRPLLAMDKREIIDLAQAIETYPVSIRPYEDCCTLFVPRHPVTRPTLSRVNDAETALDIDRLLDESMDSLETRMIEG
ncbi:MAG: tRNA 4-thiouridine(8) synthase ThiI [Dethiobacter sp.]|nr:tRNA 4-thiouridine(8) synthase ThiI [Dethiobacter sp.]